MIILKQKRNICEWVSIEDFREDFKQECKNEGNGVCDSWTQYNENVLFKKLLEEGNLSLLWADYMIVVKQDNGIAKFMDLNDSMYLLVTDEIVAQRREVIVNFTANDAIDLMSDAQKSEQRGITQDYGLWTFKANDGIDIDIKITTGDDYEN